MRNVGDALVRVVQYLAQAKNRIEIGREYDLTGQLPGDIRQHLEALSLEFVSGLVRIGGGG